MYCMQKLVSFFRLKACTLVVLFGLSSEKNQDLNPPLSLVAIIELSKKKRLAPLFQKFGNNYLWLIILLTMSFCTSTI